MSALDATLQLSDLKTPSKRLTKRLGWAILVVLVLMNLVAFFHAWKFTHFTPEPVVKTKNPEKLSAGRKILTLIFGVNNPRPRNKTAPAASYDTVILKSNRRIECWEIKIPSAKGTVVVFHGFSGEKSAMLDKAEVFRQLGYNTLLVDFMGSGGSEGNQTTVGYLEAEQVKSCMEYLEKKGERNIVLFGTSMGSAAIMKAISDHRLRPESVIIECPFGTMYQTVVARFRAMKAPVFPMAGLLVFWGGVQNGFWAFDHNPVTYAKAIDCPTLLMHGAKDASVSMAEITEIFSNLKGRKRLKIYTDAGHENYLRRYKAEWMAEVEGFLNQ